MKNARIARAFCVLVEHVWVRRRAQELGKKTVRRMAHGMKLRAFERWSQRKIHLSNAVERSSQILHRWALLDLTLAMAMWKDQCKISSRGEWMRTTRVNARIFVRWTNKCLASAGNILPWQTLSGPGFIMRMKSTDSSVSLISCSNDGPFEILYQLSSRGNRNAKRSAAIRLVRTRSFVDGKTCPSQTLSLAGLNRPAGKRF